jgi:hypothetical protein
MDRLSALALDRTTLLPQGLLERRRSPPTEPVTELAGPQTDRRGVDEEAEQLIRFMGPEATGHRVSWEPI